MVTLSPRTSHFCVALDAFAGTGMGAIAVSKNVRALCARNRARHNELRQLGDGFLFRKMKRSGGASGAVNAVAVRGAKWRQRGQSSGARTLHHLPGRVGWRS
ncbi:hypothetical protein TRVL_09407 [Trypanosoma vivax]|nr:hypothetical protein TRVL_09407 [Trypanosoma vivax]